MKISKLVVGLDFSEPSERALEAGAELARRDGAEIHLVHAVSLPAASAPWDGVGQLMEAVVEAAQKDMGKRAAELEASGLVAHAHVATAAPAELLTDRAREVEAELIVVGTHGHTGLEHFFLGSVAERTVRLAECPVLTVRAEERKPGQGPIVVATDFSATAQKAVDLALEWAAEGESVELVHALDTDRLGSLFLGPQPVIDVVAEARKAAEHRLAREKERVEAGGRSVEVQLVQGEASRTLAEHAEQRDARVLVLGTRGHTGLRHLALGSVAERTLRHCKTPVLTTRG